MIRQKAMRQEAMLRYTGRVLTCLEFIFWHNKESVKQEHSETECPKSMCQLRRMTTRLRVVLVEANPCIIEPVNRNDFVCMQVTNICSSHAEKAVTTILIRCSPDVHLSGITIRPPTDGHLPNYAKVDTRAANVDWFPRIYYSRFSWLENKC